MDPIPPMQPIVGVVDWISLATARPADALTVEVREHHPSVLVDFVTVPGGISLNGTPVAARELIDAVYANPQQELRCHLTPDPMHFGAVTRGEFRLVGA